MASDSSNLLTNPLVNPLIKPLVKEFGTQMLESSAERLEKRLDVAEKRLMKPLWIIAAGIVSSLLINAGLIAFLIFH